MGDLGVVEVRDIKAGEVYAFVLVGVWLNCVGEAYVVACRGRNVTRRGRNIAVGGVSKNEGRGWRKENLLAIFSKGAKERRAQCRAGQREEEHQLGNSEWANHDCGGVLRL